MYAQQQFPKIEGEIDYFSSVLNCTVQPQHYPEGTLYRVTFPDGCELELNGTETQTPLQRTRDYLKRRYGVQFGYLE